MTWQDDKTFLLLIYGKFNKIFYTFFGRHYYFLMSFRRWGLSFSVKLLVRKHCSNYNTNITVISTRTQLTVFELVMNCSLTIQTFYFKYGNVDTLSTESVTHKFKLCWIIKSVVNYLDNDMIISFVFCLDKIILQKGRVNVSLDNNIKL